LVIAPGLFDAMSAIGLTEIPSVQATQDTVELGAWNPHLRALDAVNPASEHVLVARANGVTHAGSSPAGSGYGIPGRASVIRLDGWTNQEMAIEPEIGVVVTWPELTTRRFDRTTARFSDRPFAEAKKEYDERVGELRSWIASARRYASASHAGTTSRTVNDLRLAGLADVVEGRLPILVRANRERQIRDAVDFAARESLRMVLVGGKEAWRVVPLLAEKKVPVILGPTQDLPLDEDEPYDRPYTLARDLKAAGLTIAISTFSATAAFTLPYEAGQAVAFGLPWEDGLAAITRAPAEILGLGDRLGTIEPGKVANLVVTDGDPLEIRTRVVQVMIDGRWVDLATKQSRSYERYRSRPLPATTK
jgi:imidazolonepropionase-like amidohydrolase